MTKTTVLSMWHSPQISYLSGRKQAHEFMVKHAIGMKCLVNLAHVVKFDSMKKYLMSTDAHEFVDIKGAASLLACVSLAKDQCGPLAVCFDVHNNDPLNYHRTGIWEGDYYGEVEEGIRFQAMAVWQQAIDEFDALFEPEYGQIGNEWADTEGDYAWLVKQVAPMMQRRGMEVIAQAPGSYPRSIIKGTHLTINGQWSLERTEGVVREYLDYGRSLDEVWGARLHSNTAKGAAQLMLPVEISFELNRDVVGVFVGDEGFPSKGPVWAGRALPTYAFQGGGATMYGHTLGNFLAGDTVEPPEPEPEVNVDAGVRKIKRKVKDGDPGWARGHWNDSVVWVANIPHRPIKTVSRMLDNFGQPWGPEDE